MFDPKGKASPAPSTAKSLIATIISELKDQPLRAASRLHELAGKAEQDHRYLEALELSSAHLQLGQDITSGPVTILALITHGRLLFKTNQFSQAITTLQEALIQTSKEKTLPPAHSAHIRYTVCHLIACSLWRDGQLPAAARALTETTSLARTRFGAGSPEVVQNLFDRAFLALEMGESEAELTERIGACMKESGNAGIPERATKALELGTALYHHCLWDAASHALDWSATIAQCPSQRTLALLTLANIASYKSDFKALHEFIDRAEQLWMDVAPRPHLERHMANLRAIAALAEGCNETYREQLTLAQERGENEELSVEDRIQIHFTRAQSLRNSGLTDQARDEIEDAHRLVQRALVSPLARFSTYLQQSFCAYTEGRHDESNDFINEALIIARNDLNGNKLLEARARWLRAQNNYAIFTYSDPSSSNATRILLDSMRDGDAALQILTEGKLDPQARIVLLRLLGGVANHLDLPIQQAWYDRQLAILEAQHPPPLR